MRRRLRLIGVVGALAATLALAAPAGAITYGELDDGEHPYVGFLIFFDPNAPGWFSCSGTLMDEDTVLTAGHCVFGVGTDGEVSPSTSGGTDMWVTFDPTDTLAGWPARTPDISEEDLYDLRSAWLNDPNNGFVRGTAIPHPEYDEFSGFPVNFDVGVVELGTDVTMGTYGELAELGAVQDLAGPTGRNRNAALVETVGYGTQAVQPHPQSDDDRYKSTSRIVQVNGNITDGGNLHTLNNPSAIGGRGGSCFGDSGGPVFVNNTNEVLAVVSFGFSGTCHGADYSWRVDTIDSYEFIGRFVDLTD